MWLASPVCTVFSKDIVHKQPCYLISATNVSTLGYSLEQSRKHYRGNCLSHVRAFRPFSRRRIMTRIALSIRFVWVSTILALFSSFAVAQYGASLEGTVTDKSG